MHAVYQQAAECRDLLEKALVEQRGVMYLLVFTAARREEYTHLLYEYQSSMRRCSELEKKLATLKRQAAAYRPPALVSDLDDPMPARSSSRSRTAAAAAKPVTEKRKSKKDGTTPREARMNALREIVSRAEQVKASGGEFTSEDLKAQATLTRLSARGGKRGCRITN